MSLLSKLFGGAKDEVADMLKKEAARAVKEAAKLGDTPRRAPEPTPAPRSFQAESGFSWGEDMPDEENQYNYPGTFVQYFDHVFHEEFPTLAVDHESLRGGRSVVCTLRDGGSKVLVVELMTEKSSANKVRSECRRAGVPYLRFYYDHDGWWNTRTYVATRCRSAMGR